MKYLILITLVFCPIPHIFASSPLLHEDFETVAMLEPITHEITADLTTTDPQTHFIQPGNFQALGAPVYLTTEDGTMETSNRRLRLSADTLDWEEMQQEVDVPASATHIILLPGLYLCTGTLDIDHLEVVAVP